MDGTDGHIRRWPRRLLPLFALLLALALPTFAAAWASNGPASGRGNAVSHPANADIGARSIRGVRPIRGAMTPATPIPIPTVASTAIPTVQQISNNDAVLPASTGNAAVSTANAVSTVLQQTSTAEPARANPRRNASSSRTPPFIVSAVVLILAAGSAVTIGGFFAFCRYVRRQERKRLRGVG